MTDVVIVNVPKMSINFLPAAPALFKGACNFLNLTSKVIDLNLDYLESGAPDLVGITEDNIPDVTTSIQCDTLIQEWVKKIISYNPRLLSISVFSYYGQYFTKRLAEEIKKVSNCYIIIGGAGISQSLNSEPQFAINLKNTNTIDDFIVGDGEIAWPTLVAKYFNIKSDILTDKLLDIPYSPDYTDSELDRYQRPLLVPVTGSKGCVRQCDFCEVHQHWKFQQRPATGIANEIKLILEYVKSPHLHFTDSLVNGSLSEFKKLIDLLIDLRKEHPFTWGGQFIIRTSKEFNDNDWQKLSASGCTTLSIGVETGNEELRTKMNKKFTNTDLDYSFDCMKKYSIKCVLLLIIGHPLETEECFEDTLALLEKYQSYNIIKTVQLGYAMSVQPGTPIYDNRADYGLTIYKKNPTIWMSKENPELTYQARFDRRVRASEFAIKLGYTMAFDNQHAINEMHHNIVNSSTQIKIIEKSI